MHEKQAISETVQIGDMVFLVDGDRAVGIRQSIVGDCRAAVAAAGPSWA